MMNNKNEEIIQPLSEEELKDAGGGVGIPSQESPGAGIGKTERPGEEPPGTAAKPRFI